MSTDLNTNARAVATVASASRSQWDRMSQGLGSSAGSDSASGRVKVVETADAPVHEPALEPPPVAAHALSVRARFDAVPWEHGASPEVPAPRPSPVATPEATRPAGRCTAQERFAMIPWETGVPAAPVGPTPEELEALARVAEARSASLSVTSFFNKTAW